LIQFAVLLLFIRALRESWKRILMVLYHSFPVLLIIFAYLIFCSLVAYIMFGGETYNNKEYFEDIPHTMFNMYVLLTTSNFPDIIFPFWRIHNITALYFIGFLMTGLYMLFNLMLAIFYNNYKHQINMKIG